MGIDQHSEEIQEYKYISGESGQADSIFLAVLDPANNKLSVIAVSRDTMTEIATYDAKGNYIGDSLNHLGLEYAFGDGKETSCQYMVDAVSKLFYGIPINGYVAFNMSTISQLNDAVGGVTVTVPEDENISVAEAKMRKQLDEQNDKYVRLYAEYDNYRKRSAKEKTDAYTDAYATAVKAFLPLLDNLERALEYEKDNEGFRMIVKQMNDIFDKLGVKEIESDGKEFDPNLHNAIIHEDDPEKGENLVLQTLQKGYTMNGKVIRHAMVKVVN